MKRRILLRAFCVWSASVVLLLETVCMSAEFGIPQTGRSQPAIGLFAARESGIVTTRVIPHDSTRLTLQVRNRTDRVVQIAMPVAFAAVPIVAQRQDFGGNQQGFFGQQGNQQGGFQQGGFQQGGQGGSQNQALGAAGNGGRNNGNAGMFSILPGKTVKKRLSCVCLEFGKKDPNPRIVYDIRPLKQVSDKSEIASLLQTLGDGRTSQGTAQLAAWHVASEIAWSDLAQLKYQRATGAMIPRYSRAQLQTARRLLEAVAAARSQKSTKKATVSLAR